jgi:hypothetical protein
VTSRDTRRRRAATRAVPAPGARPTGPAPGGTAPGGTAVANRSARAAARASASAALQAAEQAIADEMLPPWERGPVRAYLRDVVDARRHLLGVLFVPAFGLALITTFGPASGLQRTLLVVSLVALGVVLAEALVRGVAYTRMARAEFPDLQVNAVSSTFYIFMRAHRPRSTRRPAPRLRP